MKKITLICKKTGLLVLFATMAVSAAGCAESHADTPEFTTSHNRDTGFVPKTFQQQHETENADASEISDRVDKGMSEVEQQAEQMSENLEDVYKRQCTDNMQQHEFAPMLKACFLFVYILN